MRSHLLCFKIALVVVMFCVTHGSYAQQALKETSSTTNLGVLPDKTDTQSDIEEDSPEEKKTGLKDILSAIHQIESGFGQERSKTMDQQKSWQQSAIKDTDDIEKSLIDLSQIVRRGYFYDQSVDLGIDLAQDSGPFHTKTKLFASSLADYWLKFRVPTYIADQNTTSTQGTTIVPPSPGPTVPAKIRPSSYTERLIASFFINETSAELKAYLRNRLPEAHKIMPADTNERMKLANTLDVRSMVFPSLIGTDVYENIDAQQKARDFLLLSSDFAFLIDRLKRAPESNQDTDNKDDLQDSLRNQLAVYSIGLDNLFHAYLRRMPKASADAQKAGSPGESLMSQERAMVMRRLSSFEHQEKDKKSWKFQLLGINNSIHLQREQLYILAEMQYQLLELRQSLERMLLLASVAQMQQVKQNISSTAIGEIVPTKASLEQSQAASTKESGKIANQIMPQKKE